MIGKFKDEVSGIPINEFIGLRSKMYSYIKDTNERGKTAKGIKKNVITKDIKHDNYIDVLFNRKQTYHKMKTIRSQDHQLGSYEINKIHSAVLMTNIIYMTVGWTVMLMVVMRFNSLWFNFMEIPTHYQINLEK